MCIPIFTSMTEESKRERMDLFQYEYGYIHLKSYFPCSLLSPRNIYPSNNFYPSNNYMFFLAESESKTKRTSHSTKFSLFLIHLEYIHFKPHFPCSQLPGPILKIPNLFFNQPNLFFGQSQCIPTIMCMSERESKRERMDLFLLLALKKDLFLILDCSNNTYCGDNTHFDTVQ